MRLALKGLARDNPHCPKQAFPITPEILLSFHQLLELNNTYDATIWCLFGRITLGRNMASLEAYNGAGKIHTMGQNLPVKFNELPVSIMIPC